MGIKILFSFRRNKYYEKRGAFAPFSFLLHSAAVVVTTATIVTATAVIAAVTTAVTAEYIAAVTAAHE